MSATDYKHYYTFPKGTYLVNINLFANLEASTSNVLGVALHIEVDDKMIANPWFRMIDSYQSISYPVIISGSKLKVTMYSGKTIEIVNNANLSYIDFMRLNKPAYVVIHETDNWSKGANARAHALAMKNGNLAGTVHYYADSSEIYQTLDHSDGAWAVGDGKGKYGITNRNSINIEICVNPESDYYKAVDKAEQLAAYLLKQYGWGTDRLKRHYDASRKHCPRRILDEGLWPGFVKKTAAYMGAGNTSTSTTNKTITTSTTKGAGYMFNPELVKLGSTGTSVLLLQEILIARGFKGKNGKSLTLSRKADENTIYALKAYQKSRKGVLEVDGIAGEKTWKDLIAI